MPYAIQNAIFQWEDGERRVREAPELERADAEAAAAAVVDELRRRLGSSFTLAELADLYGGDVDWATQIARRGGTDADAAWAVDAAFARYAREAVDFGGGQPRLHAPRPPDGTALSRG